MIEKLLNRLEQHFGRYRGIRNLMTIIVAAMAVVYVADLVLGPALGFYLSDKLTFNRVAIFHGEIWRIITFVITPPSSSIFFIIMQLGFIYFTGSMLQNRWGTMRFNLFYFCGMIGSMIAGFITGYATSYYINLSMLLAVAILYPMMQVNLNGFIPLRLKWLAILDIVLLLPGLFNGTWGERIAIVVSLLNVALFFADRFIYHVKEAKRRYEWKKSWRTGNWR